MINSAAIRELRKNFPEAEITLAVTRTVYPLAEFCPYVDKVIALDFVGTEGVINHCRMALSLAQKYFLAEHYDTCICFNVFILDIKIFLNYFSGAKQRIGYILSPTRIYDNNLPRKEHEAISYRLLTKPLTFPKNLVHDCERDLYVLESMGLKVSSDYLEVWLGESDLQAAKNLLKDFAPGRQKIVVGIGANHPARKYPVYKYLQAFKKIVEKNAAFILIGGPAEVEDAKFLQDSLPENCVLNLIEKHLGWRVDAAVISQADGYIGNMTGCADVASVFDLPIIGLSSVSKYRLREAKDIPAECESYYPWKSKKTILLNPEHQLCDWRVNASAKLLCCTKKYSHCITQIEPEEIVAAYDRVLVKNFD